MFSKKNQNLPSLSTVLNFVGIFISVSILIIVTSVFNGFKTEFIKAIIGINSHLSIYNFDYQKISDYQQYLNQLSNLQFVKFANPVIDGQAMITSKNNTSAGVMVKSYPLDIFDKKEILKNSIKQGNISDFVGKNTILIGNELALNLGVKVGNSVTLIAPRFNETIFGSIPAHKTFYIAGIFNLGMSQYDANVVFLTMDGGGLFFDYAPNEASYIEITTDNSSKSDQYADTLISTIQTTNPIAITTWKSENRAFINAINVQSTVMTFILSLFVVITSFIMYATITIMINEKASSIAMLKNLGLANKQICAIFLTTGMVICTIAITTGILFGSVFALNIQNIKNFIESTFHVQILDSAFYFLSYLPSKVYISDIIVITISVFALVVFSILIATRKINKFDGKYLLK